MEGIELALKKRVETRQTERGGERFRVVQTKISLTIFAILFQGQSLHLATQFSPFRAASTAEMRWEWRIDRGKGREACREWRNRRSLCVTLQRVRHFFVPIVGCVFFLSRVSFPPFFSQWRFVCRFCLRLSFDMERLGWDGVKIPFVNKCYLLLPPKGFFGRLGH